MTEFKDLVGKTLTHIENKECEIVFTASDGEIYKLHHHQDCCESVTVEDVVGDLNDLVGNPILLAEEVIYDGENPPGVEIPDYQESFRWTFYKLATIKGYVDIRWYGSSNGWYSEAVSFDKVA